MIRLYLIYCKTIIRLNIVASFFVTLLMFPFIDMAKEFLPSALMEIFLKSFLTGGYLVGLLYKELFRRHETYFYYNFGISKTRLIIVSYLIHAAIAIPIIMVQLFIHAQYS